MGEDDLKEIAREFMESYLHARRPIGSHRDAFNRRPGELMVLHLLGAGGGTATEGLMVSEIGERLHVTSPTVTQHLKSLEAQGLIDRMADPSDRRVVRIRLSEAGTRYVERVDAARLEMFVGLVEHLGVDEARHFMDTMKTVSAYLRRQQELSLRQYIEAGDD